MVKKPRWSLVVRHMCSPAGRLRGVEVAMCDPARGWYDPPVIRESRPSPVKKKPGVGYTPR